MSIGYRTYGFCNGCSTEMPRQILHDDPGALKGLQKTMRGLAGKDGWTQNGSKDYCPICSKKLAERSAE